MFESIVSNRETECKMKTAMSVFAAFAILWLSACESGDDGYGEGTAENTCDESHAYWSLVLGGFGAEEIESAIQTSDGGILVAGFTSSYSGGRTGGGDGVLIKLAPGGTIEWARTYGGKLEDMFIDVKQTPDLGYIVAGWTKSFGRGGYDFWVVKVDSLGNIDWQKTYGGTSSDQAYSVDVTKDGGHYVVAGGTTSFGAGGSDYWLLKLDSTGSIVWQKAIGGPKDDAPGGDYQEYVVKALVDEEGNIIIGSESNSFGHGNADIWMVKLDDNGNLLWQNAYGDTDYDGTWTFIEAVGGGYIIPGVRTVTDTGESDMWVLKIEKENGSIVWQKTFGLPGKWDEALSVGPVSDGGAIIGAYYENPDEDADWYATIIRVDSMGELLWSKQYKNGSLDWTNAVLELDNGGFVVAGVTTTDSKDQELFLLKTDVNGNVGPSCTAMSLLKLSHSTTSTSPMSTASTPKDTDVIGLDSVASIEDIIELGCATQCYR